MKLLLDENLSPRLVDAIADLYPGSIHVDTVGLGATDDNAVWHYAKAKKYVIVSKDSDFAERSVLDPHTPKIIWVRLGNCSTREIEILLRSSHAVIRKFVEEDSETCLLLSRQALHS